MARTENVQLPSENTIIAFDEEIIDSQNDILQQKHYQDLLKNIPTDLNERKEYFSSLKTLIKLEKRNPRLLGIECEQPNQQEVHNSDNPPPNHHHHSPPPPQPHHHGDHHHHSPPPPHHHGGHHHHSPPHPPPPHHHGGHHHHSPPSHHHGSHHHSPLPPPPHHHGGHHHHCPPPPPPHHHGGHHHHCPPPPHHHGGHHHHCPPQHYGNEYLPQPQTIIEYGICHLNRKKEKLNTKIQSIDSKIYNLECLNKQNYQNHFLLPSIQLQPQQTSIQPQQINPQFFIPQTPNSTFNNC
ncbi:hypothetical protein ACTFIY_005713 [Dictyostelium cf. discoideum]